MPANVGEMFYYGDVPWHGEGTKVHQPLTVDEALEQGALDWEVGEANLQTCDNPPSPVLRRKALVRCDRPEGHEGRVLGVAHLGFEPLQNRDGAMLFDAIFGKGQPVYYTGGYLGSGEVVWLMAKIDKTLTIGKKDLVQPYALFSNSHDGSQAFSISLTTVRVVCQNTLNLAIQEKGMGAKFRRAHAGSIEEHTAAATAFWGSVMAQLDQVEKDFRSLAARECSADQFEEILDEVFPLPAQPDSQDDRVLKSVATRRANLEKARKAIVSLRQNGKGADLESARGTLWGALNAITRYIDHEGTHKGRIGYALLGQGRDLKMKAHRLVQEMSQSV